MGFSWWWKVAFRWCWAGSARRHRRLFRRLSGSRSDRKVPAPAGFQHCFGRRPDCDRWQPVHRFAILVRQSKAMIISSYVRLGVMVVLLAHATAYSGTQTESIPKGQIVERIEALSDSSQSYALYLPSNYTADRKWPVLYAFDPGARGRIPVERFKAAAEKYGWIVVGSNNSRNGPLEGAVKAWNAMQTDTHQRFAIDDERMYGTGFSGGARAAVRIAIACKCLAGVMANGAGFPIDLAPS